MRNSDSHIITVDRYTFINDARFQCLHPEDSDEWTLQIQYVRPRDAGLYECQVSTEPKIWRTIQLSVVGESLAGGPTLVNEEKHLNHAYS